MTIHSVLPLLQWPAMAVAVAGSWYVGNKARRDRNLGFIILVVSNVLWIAWGCADTAWALVIMQIFFIIVNGRGFIESRQGSDGPS